MDRKIVALSVLSILLLAGLVYSLMENSRKNEVIGLLNAELQDLELQNARLQLWLSGNITQYERRVNQLRMWLENNISRYEEEVNSLNSQLSRLQAEKIQLQLWLSGNISRYEEQISVLNSQKAALEDKIAELTAMYDDLYASHEKLVDEYNDYMTAYQSLVDRVNWRWDKNNLEAFITPEDSSVKSIVYSVTGGWSNTSNWSEFWTDVKAMYDWVVSNIEYRYDGFYPMLPYDPHEPLSFWDEMWQLPNETLELRKGDCEDMAILLCSMIRAYASRERSRGM